MFSIRRLVYLLLVACVACGSLFFFPPKDAFWFAAAAMTLACISLGDFFLQRIEYILLTGLCAATSVFLTSWLMPILLFQAIFVVLIILSCFWWARIKPHLFYPAFIVSIFTLLASIPTGRDVNANAVALLLGVLFVCISQLVFLPRFAEQQLKAYRVMGLHALQDLGQAIFTCLTQADYKELSYTFERRIHLRKLDFLYAWSELKRLIAVNRLPHQSAYTQHFIVTLENLYIALLDSAQLRLRISDYSTLSICQQELLFFAKEFDKACDYLIKRFAGLKAQEFNQQSLEDAIAALDDNYQHVLKVSAHEPFFFVDFTASLKRIVNELARVDALIKDGKNKNV